MYSIFKLPDDFLNRDYTDIEKESFDRQINEYLMGKSGPIYEDLTPAQKNKVSKWYTHDWTAKKAHDAVFGKDVERLHLPYDTSQDEPVTTENYHRNPIIRNVDGKPIHRTILGTLKGNGYVVEDYETGLTHHESDPKRKLKISSVLSSLGIAKEKAIGHYTKNGDTMTYEQAYAADPVRAAAKKDKQIIITRNKYDVAGMSTGRGWSSCMNLKDGSNRHYVRHDINHGTLTAYLCTTDDNGIHHPIGRVNLKKFEHVTTGHIIYRPEDSVYGTVPTKFQEKVNDWASKAYPEKDAGIYQKNIDLYDDDGNSSHFVRLHELDPEKNLHKMVTGIVDTTRAEYERKHEDSKNEYIEPWDDVATERLTKFHQSLTPVQKAHSVIHWLADSSYENSGDAPRHHEGETSGFLHTYYDDMINHDDYEVHGIDSFKPHDTLHALNKIHEAIGGSEDGDHHNLKKIHGKLLDHTFSSHGDAWDMVRGNIISHMTEPNNADYYFNHRDPMIDHSMHISRNHLPELLTNPRHIHKFLDIEDENGLRNSLNNEQVIDHIAAHTDAKLAHKIVYEHGEKSERPALIQRFMTGLNHNQNGENISHTFLERLHLMGASPNDVEMDERNAIKHMAQHTNFKSVFDAIQARSKTDMNTDEIKQALKNNRNFKYHDPIMEQYLRYL